MGRVTAAPTCVAVSTGDRAQAIDRAVAACAEACGLPPYPFLDAQARRYQQIRTAIERLVLFIEDRP
jgi:hypothetical protein